jgi:hypothetical protein
MMRNSSLFLKYALENGINLVQKEAMNNVSQNYSLVMRLVILNAKKKEKLILKIFFLIISLIFDFENNVVMNF